MVLGPRAELLPDRCDDGERGMRGDRPAKMSKSVMKMAAWSLPRSGRSRSPPQRSRSRRSRLVSRADRGGGGGGNVSSPRSSPADWRAYRLTDRPLPLPPNRLPLEVRGWLVGASDDERGRLPLAVRSVATTPCVRGTPCPDSDSSDRSDDVVRRPTSSSLRSLEMLLPDRRSSSSCDSGRVAISSASVRSSTTGVPSFSLNGSTSAMPRVHAASSACASHSLRSPSSLTSNSVLVGRCAASACQHDEMRAATPAGTDDRIDGRKPCDACTRI
mmetsp:Transcript_10786/g.34238  ORF Transcript_10786/g.34238 Transcript_10786/m.34238 type:complete len:273 (+) Transcript_10786:604-1422(+)